MRRERTSASSLLATPSVLCLPISEVLAIARPFWQRTTIQRQPCSMPLERWICNVDHHHGRGSHASALKVNQVIHIRCRSNRFQRERLSLLDPITSKKDTLVISLRKRKSLAVGAIVGTRRVLFRRNELIVKSFDSKRPTTHWNACAGSPRSPHCRTSITKGRCHSISNLESYSNIL